VRRAVGLVLTGCLSVQFGAALAVKLFDQLGPGGAVLLRLTFATLVLLAVWRPRPADRSRPELRLTVGFGLVLGLMNWSFYESLARIPLGAAVTIEFVGPLAVAVLGSRRPLDVVWVLCAATGVVVLAGPFGAGALNAAGVGLALAAGCCWATYILLAARVGRVWPGNTGTAFAMGFGALVALPAGIVQGGGHLVHPALLLAALGVALASSVIPYSLEMEALRTLPESVFGVMMSLEPGIAAVAGFLLLGQSLSGGRVVAIALVVTASAGATLTAARRRRLPSSACPPSPSVTVAS
jgi:inner membrane transporter RhtA